MRTKLLQSIIIAKIILQTNKKKKMRAHKKIKFFIGKLIFSCLALLPHVRILSDWNLAKINELFA